MKTKYNDFLKVLEKNDKLYESNIFVNIRQYFENLIDEIKKWFIEGEFSKVADDNSQTTLMDIQTNETPESMIRYLIVSFETSDGYHYQLQISLNMEDVDQSTGKFDKLTIELKKYDSASTQMLRPWIETISPDQFNETFVIDMIGKLSSENIENRSGDRPALDNVSQIQTQIP